MASLGVAAIIGNHPHVMQPVETIGHTVVAFSLGNFIAWQKDTERKTSVILYLTLQNNRDGKLHVVDFKGIPVFRIAQEFFPAYDKITPAQMAYVSKHLGKENIVLGKDLETITRCQ